MCRVRYNARLDICFEVQWENFAWIIYILGANSPGKITMNNKASLTPLKLLMSWIKVWEKSEEGTPLAWFGILISKLSDVSLEQLFPTFVISWPTDMVLKLLRHTASCFSPHNSQGMPNCLHYGWAWGPSPTISFSNLDLLSPSYLSGLIVTAVGSSRSFAFLLNAYWNSAMTVTLALETLGNVTFPEHWSYGC